MTTALVYDPVYLEHDTDRHPENAGRLVSTMEALKESGLLDLVKMISPEAAAVDDIATVHSPVYVEQVRRVAESGGAFLDADTYVSPGSYEAAIFAAGGTFAAMESVLTGEVDNAFALVRPPGHHALASRGMGFCIFNNIAIATRVAQRRHAIDRVLIVDFDVHHGNGTQAAFWRDGSVLYFSVHQSPFYPGTGGLNDIGEGDGRGYTANVPLPGGVGDPGYRRVFEEVLDPLARRFQPQVIAVSAGYDLHWADPIGGMRVTTTGFAWMVRHLMALADELCERRLVLTLEGGYNLQALADSVVATVQVMMGREFEDKLGPARSLWPEPDIESILDRAKAIHDIE